MPPERDPKLRFVVKWLNDKGDGTELLQRTARPAGQAVLFYRFHLGARPATLLPSNLPFILFTSAQESLCRYPP